MKKPLLALFSILFFLFSFSKAEAQYTVSNGASTGPINFPAGSCTYTWTNNNTSIGLAANGTGNIPSFTAINTGSSPVTATITGTPARIGYAYIASISTGTVDVINTSNNSVVNTIQLPADAGPWGVAVSQDGSWLYIANSNNNTISVINTTTNKVVNTITGIIFPYGIAVSPDGNFLYITNYSPNTVSVISTVTNKLINTINVGKNPTGICISPDGKSLYVANSLAPSVSVISTATKLVTATIPISGSIAANVCLSPNGGLLYVSSGSLITVIKTSDNTIVAKVPVGYAPIGISVSADGSKVYVADGNSNEVSVIDAATNAVTGTIPVGIQPEGTSLSADGSNLYVENYRSNNVSVISTLTNAVTATIPVVPYPNSLGVFTVGETCSNPPVTYTITINPTPGTTPTITATTASGAISACAGSASASPQIQQFTVSGSGLTGNITATAPTNFEISLAAGSGYSNSLTLNQTGGAVNSTVVYVRSAATASTGSIFGNITLTSAGASSQTVAVEGTVNALPIVNTVGNQTVTNGLATTAINFTGTANTFTWVNDTPGIGLAANGNGDIASFAAVNTGSVPVTATITVTPINAGMAYIANAATIGNDVLANDTIYVVNTVSGRVVSKIVAGASSNGVSVSPDGSRVYVANLFSNNVSVISTSTNAVIATIPVGANPWWTAVSPDGTRVYVSNTNSHSVSIISTASNSVIATVTVGNIQYVGPGPLTISPDSKLVYVTYDKEIFVINAATKTVVSTIPLNSGSLGSITLSPDGSKLYVEDNDNKSLDVIALATNAITAKIPVGNGGEQGILINADGSRVYVSNGNLNTVVVINTATNLVIATIPVGSNAGPMSLTSDGSELFVENAFANNVSVINTATNQVVKTIPVGTGPFGFGNFITPGASCTGTPVTFTITVKPTPGTTPTITATTPTGAISACAGTASVSPQIQQFSVSGSGLTGSITATAPTNFEISLTSGSGYSNSLTVSQTAGTVNNTIIYVRSAATASTGSISGNVTLTSAGASNQTVAVTGMVNGLPTVNPVGNQTVNNGATTTAVNFTGTGNTFTWVNDTPGIGLAASGTGDIASFRAVNTGASPVKATITVTPKPVLAGYAYITNSGSNTVSVISTDTKSLVTTIPVGKNPYGVSVSPNGAWAYVANMDDNSVSVINTATNTVITTIPVGTRPQGVLVSPDGSTVYVADGWDNNVSVINTTSNTVTSTIAAGEGPEGLAISQDGKTLYVANGEGNNVYVINIASGNIMADIGTGFYPNGLSLSPDGSLLYITTLGTVSGNIMVINTANDAVLNTIPLGTPNEVWVSPDGSKIYVANSYDVKVINAATDAITATIPIGASYGISGTADGAYVYVTDIGLNNVYVINTTTNAVVSTIPVGASPYSFGNFISNANSCTGIPITFTITVNPTPVSPTITATAATGAISACAGSASLSTEQFTVSGNGLTGNITATAPPGGGFEISLAAGSGYSSNISIPQTSGTVSSTIVYVRSAATASTGSLSGNVTLTSPGLVSQTVAVKATVNALPTVNMITNQSVNNGGATTAVNFTGSATTFDWVNDTPGIGLAASGTGNMASFTAVNTGASPVVANITVTPQSPGIAYIPNQIDNTVSVINILTNTVIATINVGRTPTGVAISPDNTRVYITNQLSQTVSVIDATTNTVIASIPVAISPYAIAITPDGSQVYVANLNSSSISVINTATNVVVKVIPVGPNPFGLAISPDGKTLYVTDQQSISVISTATNAVIGSINIGVRSLAIVVSPDGSKLFATNPVEHTVSVISTASHSVIATVPVEAGADAISLSPDGRFAYVANQNSNSVSVINTLTNSVVATIPVGMMPTGLSLNADGSLLYVANDASNSVSVINTATNMVVKDIGVGKVPVAAGNFVSTGGGCSGAPVSFTITVNPGPPTIIASTATGSISACGGTASASPNIQQFTVLGSGLTGSITAAASVGFEISLAAGSGYSSNISIPQTSGAVIGTIIYVRSAATASTGGISGNVTLTSTGASSQIVAVTGTVNPMVTASLVIAASGNNICAGTPVTFTASPTNGGSTPVYQWLLNGSNVGTNSPTFSSNTLANGDVVSCVLTSSYACAAPANATSNSVTMIVIANVAPSVSILASQNAICTGSPVTFTATPINGGNAPAYQWLVNGNSAGTNSATFSSSNFADGDVISCVLTSNAACATPASATSNSINMSVNPLVSPAVSIAASQNNICPGTNITFTATPTNGGGNPTYQWLLNGNSTGTNSPTFASNTLSNGDQISCRLTSNAACLAAPDATSNTIAMVVNTLTVPAVSIGIWANNVCAGTPVTFTASTANGGSSPVYQWLVNGNNAGTNSPTFSSGTLANGDVVSCVLTSNAACATPATAASNSITTNIFALPAVNGGGNKTIEKGSSVMLTATTSGDIADITWTPGTGLDNNKVLNPQASPASTTLYTITVQTAGGCIATDAVTVTVLDGIVIPNTFTPNGDGINDKWNIQNLNDYQNSEVRVFDRYGGEVYNSKGYYTAWDGTENGRPLPVGTYYYLINLNNGSRPLSGFVALIR